MYKSGKKAILFMIALIVPLLSVTSVCCEGTDEGYVLFGETVNQGQYGEYTLYGYKDRSGNTVIPCEYKRLYGFIDGACVAVKYVTSMNEWARVSVFLIDGENTVICELDSYAFYLSYEENWYETAKCFVVYDESQGVRRVINRQGKEALADEFQYNEAYQSGPYIIIEQNEDDCMCIDRYMQAALGGKHFESIYFCQEDDEGKLYFPVREGGLIGVVDENGEYATQPAYTKLDYSLVYPCYEAYYPDGTFTYAAYDGHAIELPVEWINMYW